MKVRSKLKGEAIRPRAARADRGRFPAKSSDGKLALSDSSWNPAKTRPNRASERDLGFVMQY